MGVRAAGAAAAETTALLTRQQLCPLCVFVGGVVPSLIGVLLRCCPCGAFSPRPCRSNKYSPACLHTIAHGATLAEEPAACLITGLGRTGTTYVTELLRVLGWSMSHDNGGDYCPCPGLDGAVSYPLAWASTERCKIETFAPKTVRLFRNVVHQVREPLAYINSRAVSTNMLPFSGCRLKRPKSKELRTPKWAQHVLHVLHKYVLQNTFVGAYADWRFRIEDLRDSSAAAQKLCWQCGLDTRARNRTGAPLGCPAEHEIDTASDFLPQDTNHNHSSHANFTWRELFHLDPDMTTAAIILGRLYGYAVEPLEETVGMRLECGFVDDDIDKAWSCTLDRSSSAARQRPKPAPQLVRYVPGVGSLVRRFERRGAILFEVHHGPGSSEKENVDVTRAELVESGHGDAVGDFERLGPDRVLPKSRHQP